MAVQRRASRAMLRRTADAESAAKVRRNDVTNSHVGRRLIEDRLRIMKCFRNRCEAGCVGSPRDGATVHCALHVHLCFTVPAFRRAPAHCRYFCQTCCTHSKFCTCSCASCFFIHDFNLVDCRASVSSFWRWPIFLRQQYQRDLAGSQITVMSDDMEEQSDRHTQWSLQCRPGLAKLPSFWVIDRRRTFWVVCADVISSRHLFLGVRVLVCTCFLSSWVRVCHR